MKPEGAAVERGARLGVDIGGTFTDVALEADGCRYSAKILTTPEAPESAVLEAIGTVLQDAALAEAATVDAFLGFWRRTEVYTSSCGLNAWMRVLVLQRTRRRRT
jgi:hypothetical protein